MRPASKINPGNLAVRYRPLVVTDKFRDKDLALCLLAVDT
jgi:hypothetical protein